MCGVYNISMNLKYITLFAAAVLCVNTAYASQENLMKVKFNVNNQVIDVQLNNSTTSKDLWNKLPLTLVFYPHQSREIYSNIELNKSEPVVDSYAIGDVAYWTPGNALVLYFGPGYTDSLIPMGKMVSD